MKQYRDTHYQVDEYGNVYGRNRYGTIIKLKGKIHKGYLSYNLSIEWKLAHRMVAELYLSDFNNELQVNHKDFNKLNNHVSNLEMMTGAENMKHYYNSHDSSFININKDKKGKTYQELYPDKYKELKLLRSIESSNQNKNLYKNNKLKEKNISKHFNKFYVRKEKDKVLIISECFNSLEEAKNYRDNNVHFKNSIT